MRARLSDRLDQLFDNMGWRRHIWIAHAEIDNIGTTRARRRLQPVDLGEYVGRQAFNTMEIFSQIGLLSRLVKQLLRRLPLLARPQPQVQSGPPASTLYALNPASVQPGTGRAAELGERTAAITTLLSEST